MVQTSGVPPLAQPVIIPISEFVDFNFVYRLTETEIVRQAASFFSGSSVAEIISRHSGEFTSAFSLPAGFRRRAQLVRARKNLNRSMRLVFSNFGDKVLNPLADITARVSRIKYQYLQERKLIKPRVRLEKIRGKARTRVLHIGGDSGIDKFNESRMLVQERFSRHVARGMEQAARLSGTVPFAKISGQAIPRMQTVMRTIAQGTISTAEINTAAEIADRYRYVAILDTRTTVRCRGLNGRIYQVGEGPLPPQHYNCRSEVQPVLQDEVRDKQLAESNNVKYQIWLRRQKKSTQNSILGGTNRGKLFREGKIKPPPFGVRMLAY